MTRRQFKQQKRFKRFVFVFVGVVLVAACGKATLSRDPDAVTDTVVPDAVVDSDTATDTDAEPGATVRAGIIKQVKTALYAEGTHYLQDDQGAFMLLLTSSTVDLRKYEDQMVEVTGALRTVTGDTAEILDVTSVASVSDKLNDDAVKVVQLKADPSYGFTPDDTYTLVASSATAGTAVVQIEHAGKIYHAKLVKKPDPILGDWEIYEIAEGEYKGGSGSGETLGEGATVMPEGAEQPVTVSGSLNEAAVQKEGYGTYEDTFALFSIQYPKPWFFWVVGEAQTAEGKPVSSRVLFSDQKVEYSNVLIGLDVAPVGFDLAKKTYYTDNSGETSLTVRGQSGVKRTYATGAVRILLPRSKDTTFIISALPREGTVKTDVLNEMLSTLTLNTQQ